MDLVDVLLVFASTLFNNHLFVADPCTGAGLFFSAVCVVQTSQVQATATLQRAMVVPRSILNLSPFSRIFALHYLLRC